MKDYLWKFLFLFSLPVTTRNDGRHAQPTIAHPNGEIYHRWKFHDSIFHSFWENGKAIFALYNSISHHRKYLFENYLTLIRIFLVSTTYINFKWNTLVIEKILGIENIEFETCFLNNRKLTLQFLVGLIVLDTWKQT